ncbi:MAG: branched-chain amino acid ABC transporter permease [Chloroflexota bacterium]
MTILIYGLVNSVILILTALGFSLTFGLSKVANFAHGGLYLFAGFSAWLLVNKLHVPYGVSIIVAIVLTGLLGAFIYQVILQRVRGIELAEIISTFALGIAIIETFRSLGFVTVDYSLAPFVRGGTRIFGVAIDYQRLTIIGVGLLLAVLMWVFTHHTKIGLALRGIAQDEHTALTLGIESDWAATISVALGAALTAVAALTILPLGIISIDQGYEVLLIAIAVAVLGGLESTVGLLVSGLILGYSQVIASTVLGTQWQAVVYLVAIVVVLTLRPSGLLGRFKELEERV